MAKESKATLRQELSAQRGMTDAAIAAAGQAALSAERWHETADAAFELAKEAVDVAREAGELARWFADRLEAREDWDVLDAQELEVFAELYPNWTINSGIFMGEARKAYSRTIPAEELAPERRRGGALEHETYRELADDYLHQDLLECFGTWSGCGGYMNGKYYVVNIYAETAGPVTYEDYKRVKAAETYFAQFTIKGQQEVSEVA